MLRIASRFRHYRTLRDEQFSVHHYVFPNVVVHTGPQVFPPFILRACFFIPTQCPGLDTLASLSFVWCLERREVGLFIVLLILFFCLGLSVAGY